MCGISCEPGQDAIWVTIRKSVDLHRVVGACRHQFAVLWKSMVHHELVYSSSQHNLKQQVTHLESQRVSLFPNSDELWIIVIQTLPYPNISIISTRDDKSEENVIMSDFRKVLI